MNNVEKDGVWLTPNGKTGGSAAFEHGVPRKGARLPMLFPAARIALLVEYTK